MTRLDGETRSYLRREIDRRKRVEIEGLREAGPRWTRVTVMEAIRTFEAMTGRPPSRSDFDHGAARLPSARTVARIYGTIADALDAAYPVAAVEIETQATLFEVA